MEFKLRVGPNLRKTTPYSPQGGGAPPPAAETPPPAPVASPEEEAPLKTESTSVVMSARQFIAEAQQAKLRKQGLMETASIWGGKKKVAEQSVSTQARREPRRELNTWQPGQREHVRNPLAPQNRPAQPPVQQTQRPVQVQPRYDNRSALPPINLRGNNNIAGNERPVREQVADIKPAQPKQQDVLNRTRQQAAPAAHTHYFEQSVFNHITGLTVLDPECTCF